MGGLKENINACLIEGASNFQGSFHKNLMYPPILTKEKLVDSSVTPWFTAACIFFFQFQHVAFFNLLLLFCVFNLNKFHSEDDVRLGGSKQMMEMVQNPRRALSVINQNILGATIHLNAINKKGLG